MRIPQSERATTLNLDTATTPLIDVVFLLLVFFICASVGQLRENVLPADLPVGGVATIEAATPPPPLGEVRVKLFWNGERTTAQVEGTEHKDLRNVKALLTTLAETAPELPVTLAVDDEVPLGDVLTIYDTCRASGFETIRFALKTR